eukprot:187945_1
MAANSSDEVSSHCTTSPLIDSDQKSIGVKCKLFKSKLFKCYIHTLILLFVFIGYYISNYKSTINQSFITSTLSDEFYLDNIHNGKKMVINQIFIFVLVPAYQGSTILYELIASSDKASSFLGQCWVGEGQWFLNKEIKDFAQNKWNPNYRLNMTNVKEIFDAHWDLSKNIFVEKSPPNIVRAKMFEEYFSNFGRVYINMYFVISMRSPYSTNYTGSRWVKFAGYQKTNIETLNNTIVTSYEELCRNQTLTSTKILNAIPELGKLHFKSRGNGRHGKISNLKTKRLIGVKNKNLILRQNMDLVVQSTYTTVVHNDVTFITLK